MPQKRDIDLKASTPGEKWFQHAVNHSLGLWFSASALVLGVLFTILYHDVSYSESGAMVYLGPLWIMFSLVHFERYQARKAFERLMEVGMMTSDARKSEEPER